MQWPVASGLMADYAPSAEWRSFLVMGIGSNVIILR